MKRLQATGGGAACLLGALVLAAQPVEAQSPGGNLLNLPFVDTKEIVFVWATFLDPDSPGQPLPPVVSQGDLQGLAGFIQNALQAQSYGKLTVNVTISLTDPTRTFWG